MGQLLYADEIHTVEQSKIDAARITQASGNARRGSDAAVARFSASLATSRNLDAAGSRVADLAGNSARIMAKAASGKLSARIAAAEELGAATAMAGAAGVGGASVEAYNTTVRLQNAVREQAVERSLDQQEWAIGQQRGNTVKTAVANIDNTTYRANMDYTQYLDHKKPSIFERVATLGATVAATVFAGPQAGAAVMGVFEARQAARNGDYASASSAIMGSAQNGMGAARSYQATHGEAPRRADTGSAEQQSSDISVVPFRFNSPPPTWGAVTIK